MGVGGKESKRTVTCKGSFLEIPGKFAGPKRTFCSPFFVQDQDIEIFEI